MTSVLDYFPFTGGGPPPAATAAHGCVLYDINHVAGPEAIHELDGLTVLYDADSLYDGSYIVPPVDAWVNASIDVTYTPSATPAVIGDLLTAAMVDLLIFANFAYTQLWLPPGLDVTNTNGDVVVSAAGTVWIPAGFQFAPYLGNTTDWTRIQVVCGLSYVEGT